jgi:hypothetical protein
MSENIETSKRIRVLQQQLEDYGVMLNAVDEALNEMGIVTTNLLEK